MEAEAPLDRLVALLAASGAEPVLSSAGAAPSTIYDLEYRVLVVSMAFQMHAASDRFSARPRIQGRRLKLLQFVAMRSWLVPVIREWSASRHDAQRSLESEEGLRRGFISDTMHDNVMDFLFAAGALRREDQFVIAGPSSSVVFDLHTEAIKLGLFRSEAMALEQLKFVVVTNDMLEGW